MMDGTSPSRGLSSREQALQLNCNERRGSINVRSTSQSRHQTAACGLDAPSLCLRFGIKPLPVRRRGAGCLHDHFSMLIADNVSGRAWPLHDYDLAEADLILPMDPETASQVAEAARFWGGEAPKWVESKSVGPRICSAQVAHIPSWSAYEAFPLSPHSGDRLWSIMVFPADRDVRPWRHACDTIPINFPQRQRESCW